MPSNSNILDFQDLINRAIAICKETISGSEGYAFWLTSQESFPYFISQIRDIDPVFVNEDEISTFTFKLWVRHIVGNRTEGMSQTGEVEGRLYQQIPLILNAFLSSDLMQSTEEPTAPDWLERFDLMPCPGLQVGDAAGIGAVGQQIFTTYIFDCEARVQIDQTYE